MERKAAYKVASTEISSWQDTISSNRSSRQVDLTAPLPALLTLEQITTDLQTSGFRSEVNKALGLGQAGDSEQVESSMRSKVRSDRFHEYQKQKRTAKIKSKLYHKIRNKRKDKEMLTAEEQAEEDDLKRIEERISLRHSAAKLKKIVRKYVKDEGKKIISENEALRQRIKNPSRVNSVGQVVYDSSSDEEFLAEQLGLEIDAGKGIMDLKFMQEAQKRQREQAEILADGLLRDLEESAKFEFTGKAKGKGNGKGVGMKDEGLQKGMKMRIGASEVEEEKAPGVDLGMEKRKKRKVEQGEQQMKLVEQAFELDDMDQVAAEEWARETNEKKEKEPKMRHGWGTWFGSGTRQKTNAYIPAHKVDKVIHNEDRDKRAAKYLVKQIPFPFKSCRQFDSINKIPVSKEWNSNKVFQKQIAPEILTRDGEIIAPISK